MIGQQIEYSLVERTPDRELLPMARALGLGTVAWSPLGGGLLTGKYRRGEAGRAMTWKNLYHEENTAQKTAILDALQAALAPDQLRRLDQVSAVPLGFPHEMLDRFQTLEQQLAGGKADLLDLPVLPVP